jgi:hypothetical protein
MLQRIASAMAADSRLLIAEAIVSDPPTVTQVAADLTMLAIAGEERTLALFRDLAGKAGLRIAHVVEVNELSAVVECILA